MKRLSDWLLIALGLAAAAFAAAERLAAIPTPVPPIVLAIVAALLIGFVVLRALPLKARRVAVFFITLVALAALVGGLAYLQLVVRPAMMKNFIVASFAPKPTTVAAEAARMETWPPELAAIGTLRAYQGIAVAPQVAGIVTAIHFESGDDVKAGDLLVNIDDSVEQADLANGLAQLQNANVTLARQKTLVVGGNTPQSSVDAAIAARDSAAAAVERTRAVIAQKAIKAPFPGRLGLRNVDLGQYVAVGTSLTTLQRLDPIYIDFPAPEGALKTLAVGQSVKATVDAIPGREFVGAVAAIDARVSAESRNVVARAQFANPDGKLLPGMFADVVVTTGAGAKTLTVPRTAIVYSLYGDNVFVVNKAPSGDGLVVERRFVKVGDTRGERIAIVDGVKEGEQMVTAGQIKLQSGAPVTIDPTGALPPPAETPKP